MRCDVCGLEYGMAHNCPGPLSEAALNLVNADLSAPANGGTRYYLGEALKIVRWDDLAVRRNAKDPKATMYGILFWSISAFVILAAGSIPALLTRYKGVQPALLIFGLLFEIGFGLIAMGLITFLQLGLCHLVAKWFFGATGHFKEVIRPLLLGWFVNCLALIPVAGMLLAGIGWTAVLMLAFEEVDGIGRLQAFGISAGINFLFLFLQFEMIPRHF